MVELARIPSLGPGDAVGLLHAVRRWLPRGTPLPDDVWERRHHAIVVLLWLHAAGIACYGLIAGFGLLHGLAEGAVIAVFALLASITHGARTQRAVIASLGLLTASALLVHLSGGYIEVHFHFFVMVAVITLYQNWVPFLAAIGFVVLEHGLGGLLAPTAVYNHPDAWANPWKWAAIHGVFVLGASAAAIANWRLNEGSRARTTSILHSAGEGIIGVDREGHATFVNPAALAMTGYCSGDVIGRKLEEFLRASPNTEPLQPANRDPAPNNDTYNARECQFLRKDGTEVPIEYVATPIREFDEVVGAVVTFRDVRRRKQNEAAIKETNRQLAAVVAELKQTQQQVVQQERLRALGEMASGIAHDFNNALAKIQGFSEILLDQPKLLGDPNTVREHLELINTSSKDAAAVVRRLREFYRYRDVVEPFRPVDVNDLVAQVISLTQFRWRDQAMAQGVSIIVETDLRASAPVPANEADLREALTNLVFNAVDAMPRGGSISLSTGNTPDGRVLITVGDTGVGMTEDVRKRCLEPFFTTKGDHGTGLGLAMVYGIIQRHDGTVALNSAPGAGTRVTLSLPVAEVGLSDAPDSRHPAAAQKGLRVLVAEDEPTVRRMLASYLSIDGHDIEMASDGHEAATKFRSGSFDVVLTDRAMPRMSGDQLAATVKNVAPQTPVIMLTGFGDLMAGANERPSGVDLVLSKPVSLADLRTAIATVA